MVDLHSHIIYNVDDGPSSIEESLKMINEAGKAGIRRIIATPHFHEKVFEAERAFERFDELKWRAYGLGVVLYMGNEIFSSPHVIDLIKSGRCLTLNNSKYVLLEFPFDAVPSYIFEVLNKFHSDGFIPIIAHPERNKFFLSEHEALKEFVEAGCLIQVDAGSITGVYGQHVKYLCRRLIKEHAVSFVASNAHFAEDYSDRYRKAYQTVKKWAGEEYTEKLFSDNAQKIIDEESLNKIKKEMANL